MARDDLHFRLRIPEALKAKVEKAAEDNRRSMTAEIIARLERSFDRWPEVYLSSELRNRALEGSQEQRDMAEWTISEEATRILETMFPKPKRDIRDFYEAFDAMLHDVPEDARPKFRENFQQLVMEMLEEEQGAEGQAAKNDGEVPF